MVLVTLPHDAFSSCDPGCRSHHSLEQPFSQRERCKHAHVTPSAETKYPPHPFLSTDLKPVEWSSPKSVG